jgi:antitoxin component YwqK of YwqJK toxin-antitoxin module
VNVAFINGLKEGLEQGFSLDNKKWWEVGYVNNLKQGTLKSFYPNGSLK